ncbi:MAG: RNA methyltransferase [Flavobacteriales bacterium]|nr:RNA methyltransferase [Flavobacteriales bacterium]
MPSKAHIKNIYSLKDKKSRQISQLFTIEGIKSIKEIATEDTIVIKELYAVPSMAENIPHKYSHIAQIISTEEMKQMSSQSTPEGLLAVCQMPSHTLHEWDKDTLYIALDGIRDPGNLGTIIRLADWFGVRDVICSMDTVDVYNPKTIASTMGSIARVRVHYVDLATTLSRCPVPVYGTFLNGENIYEKKLPMGAVMVIGNEAHGISPAIEAVCRERVTIPRFGDSRTESLNAAMATAILLGLWRR